MPGTDAIVAVFKDHQDVHDAVNKLRRAGFDIRKLSIIGREFQTEQHVVGYYNIGGRMKYWGALGALWGGLGGSLVGTAFFLVPGVGFVLIAGPLAAYIVSAVEGALVVGGLTPIGSGLFSIGIPKNSSLQYESALKADKLLVIVHGTGDEIQNAREIIQMTKAQEFGVHLRDAQEISKVGGATS